MRCNILPVALLVAAALAAGACKKNVFNQGVYNEILTHECPVEPIDGSHQWATVARQTVTLHVNGGIEGMARLQVLSDNPLATGKVRVMAEEKAPAEGAYYTLAFAAPASQTTFYAAVRTTDGRYAVKPFAAGSGQVDLSGCTVGRAELPPSQAFTYCFEESFPRPDDYDFNDCVLRLSLQPGTVARQLRLTVSLAAVGAKLPIAAAVRLVNYSASDIESVTIEGGRPFDDGYPLTPRALKSSETLQSGQHGEAVIRLFEDAMWSMVGGSADNVGSLTRYKVNVTRTSDNMNKQMSPVSRTYVITFRDTAPALPLLGSFTLSNLDPFIITDFNNNYWETHLYAYQNAQVMYDYPSQNELHMTWALCVPDDTHFRWPLEGHLIGTYKNGILTGAYRDAGHAFGEWAANRDTATDWYLYPTAAEVY